MFGKLKRDSIFAVIATRFVFLIVATMFFMWGGSANIVKLIHPMKFADLTEDNMNNAYVKDDIVFLYGEYMATYSYENGGDKHYSSVSMIIDPNGKNYIGVEVPSGQVTEYEGALDKCFENMEDVDWILDKPFHVSGTIVKMDKEEREYFKEYVGESYSEPDFMPYVLKINYLGNNPRTETFAITGFGLLFLGVFLYGFIKAITGMYQKPIRKFLASQSNPAYEKDKLEAAWEQAMAVGDIYLMKDYVIFMYGTASMIVRPWDIVWIYKSVTKHRTNGIPSGKTYSITLAMADGKQYDLSTNKNSSDDMLTVLREHLPGAVVGYSKELEDKYNTDCAWFSQGWNDIRNGKM